MEIEVARTRKQAAPQMPSSNLYGVQMREIDSRQAFKWFGWNPRKRQFCDVKMRDMKALSQEDAYKALALCEKHALEARMPLEFRVAVLFHHTGDPGLTWAAWDLNKYFMPD
jgi:hypothetical protein